MIPRIGDNSVYGGVRGLVGARDQQGVARCDQPLGDLRDLIWRLPLTEHDLGEALANSSVVIHPREPQILKRDLTQEVDQLVVCPGDREGAALDILKDGPNVIVVHSTTAASSARGELTCLHVGCTVTSSVVRSEFLPTVSPESLLLWSYFALLACLSVYGLHRCYLVYLYTKYRQPARGAGLPEDAPNPRVTVQLPLYNEMYVAERLIAAVARLEYPRDRLEIQVLDDSTDETRQIAQRVVAHWADRGFSIQYLHRAERTGFKAGALADGLRRATGEFIVIFDADFIPPADFLTRTLPPFRDSRVGMVQARWGHVNERCSLLTRVQAILLDAHFSIEHGARSRAGCFFNFNGTAGVWRREAIEASGGWQHDTLTEDLDLSYRAQLAGWRFEYLQDVVAPAEVPVEMNAFKTQQHRWAKGSVQTCLKVLPAVLTADLPPRVKAEAFFHLTANFNYPLMLALAVLMVPALFTRVTLGWSSLLLVDLPLFCVATLSVANFYALSQMACRRRWLAQLRYIPAVMAVGIGLAVTNTVAVIEAMLNRRGDFQRTSKYGVVHPGDDWTGKRYRQSMVGQPLIEIALGLYFTGAVLYAVPGQILALPFLCLFQFGFLYIGCLSLLQQHRGADFALRAPAASPSRVQSGGV